MTMKNFKHISAVSLEKAAAVSSKSKGKAPVIAGGTDLLGALKDKIHSESPETVIDLKTIPGLSYVKETKKGLSIGALTSLQEIATNEAVKKNFRALAEAARTVASPQIRNMGTLAGNLCQEPRCWYYRAPDNQFHCLRKGGSKCGALLGENRYHSIFGAAKTATPGCSLACPAHVEIPAYLSQIRKGKLGDAARILLTRNPIPAMTGRVCPHFCESQCNRLGFDEAVSVRAIERSVGDYVLAHAAELMRPPKKQTKKSVAIVGSGPAGLSAAYYLRTAGHQVTVFEKMAEAGGMLSYCIPGYRLSKDIVRKQIAALEAMGIKFKLNAAVGQKGMTLRDLRKNFDGVFLATGSWRQKALKIDKAELLTSGIEFLIQNTETGRKQPLGEKILVIGGGNVAVDVAISALRLGAKQVTMACLEARDTMPAIAEDIVQAHEEGVRIMPSWGPHKILESGGKLTGMELVRCTSVFDEQGRFHPSFDPAQKEVIEADQIILAIGQASDLAYVDKSTKVARGLIVATEETGATNLPGVFAGGDVTSGPATVVQAIAAGRRSALAIDSYLTGKKEAVVQACSGELLEIDGGCVGRSRRSEPSELAAEARRCANCGCVAVNASDLAPALIALGAKIKTTKRTIAADDFFAALPLKSTVLGHGELVKEIELPTGQPKSRQGYLKFRIRNSIDFPIVSLASVFNSTGGKIKNARVVLGAVAPMPLRMKVVEDFLEGKPANEETAALAGELAVRQAQPLAKNKFKMQIVRALIKKAILDLV